MKRICAFGGKNMGYCRSGYCGVPCRGVCQPARIVSNTAEAFNRQQLFLVRESARGIENFIHGIQRACIRPPTCMLLYPDQKTLAPFLLRQPQRCRPFFWPPDEGYYPAYPPQFLHPLTGPSPKVSDAGASSSKSRFLFQILLPRRRKAGDLFLWACPCGGKSLWMCCLVNFSELKKNLSTLSNQGKPAMPG